VAGGTYGTPIAQIRSYQVQKSMHIVTAHGMLIALAVVMSAAM
jgi:hypothetical protein